MTNYGLYGTVALALTVVIVAQEGDSQRTIELDGLIRPHRVVKLSSPTDGLLAEVLVDRGDLVREGEVVARLEASVERANLQVARARAGQEAGLKSSRLLLDFHSHKLEQHLSLLERGIISPESLEEIKRDKLLAEIAVLQAQEEKELATQELERSRAALEQRTIRNTVSGVVTRRFLSAGEFVSRTEAMVLEIAQIDPLQVEVIAPKELLNQIGAGGVVEIVPEKPLEGSFAGKIVAVDRVVDGASGTFGIRIELPNPGSRVTAGLRCTVRFVVE